MLSLSQRLRGGREMYKQLHSVSERGEMVTAVTTAGHVFIMHQHKGGLLCFLCRWRARKVKDKDVRERGGTACWA